MIAHVAEAGEARGRVVLRLAVRRPHPVAIEAAVRVAQAFNSEIESLFIEDEQLVALTRFPFVREISGGGRSRPLTLEAIERDFRALAEAVGRQIRALAKAAEIPVHSEIVRGEPVAALARACAVKGPWNVIALADPFAAADGPALHELLANVAGTTGMVVVGPKARRTKGPIVIALEAPDLLPSMLHAADRLAPVTGGEVLVVLLGEGEEHLAWMEGQARLVLGEREDVRIAVAELPRGASAAVAETLRRLRPGFVIAGTRGLVVPAGDLGPLAAALECPLFLVREPG